MWHSNNNDIVALYVLETDIVFQKNIGSSLEQQISGRHIFILSCEEQCGPTSSLGE